MLGLRTSLLLLLLPLLQLLLSEADGASSRKGKKRSIDNTVAFLLVGPKREPVSSKCYEIGTLFYGGSMQ